MAIPWIMISIAVIIVILAIFMIFALKGKKRTPPDYFAFFIIGLSWIAIGIPLSISTDNFAFMAIGIVFFAIGLANKNKWKKNRAMQKKWKDLDKTEKRIRMFLLIAVGIGVLVLLIFYLLNAF
ncbi:hypothetical protein KY336_00160 [Candidatus Woesearchaeota archaeon]|nr:hypothetical protein [Candidatus Woesearchaeota archaeon]